jgi:hypothetical protein
MKKKISRKLELKKETLSNLKGGIMYVDSVQQADWDTPTINDNCNFATQVICPTTLTQTLGQNTFCVCNPDDWCGYRHETNCAGPLLSWL